MPERGYKQTKGRLLRIPHIVRNVIKYFTRKIIGIAIEKQHMGGSVTWPDIDINYYQIIKYLSYLFMSNRLKHKI